jgi:uncharacterized membrane protein
VPEQRSVTPPAAPVSSRLLEVDVVRVCATLFMVQGHTLDVLLVPAFREGVAYNLWLFLRGLTAPTFLFLSGFSFTVSAMKRWDSYLGWSSGFFRRMRKFAFFVLLGYAMHLPVSSFRDLSRLDAAGWRGWFQVDVLQCIGLTLILLQLAVFLCRTPQRFARLALVLGGAIVLLTPVTARIEWQRVLPLPIASYFNLRTGSLFPLFPWAGYIFAGAAMGFACLRWRAQAKLLLRRALPAAGLLLFLVGLLRLPDLPYSSLDYWTASPSLFFVRVGLVFLLLTGVGYVTDWIKLPARPIQALAQESLSIYFVHICILYGSVWNLGLRQRVGSTLPVLPTVAAIAAMISLMVTFGLGWHWLKKSDPQAMQLARSAAVALAIAYCFM